MLDFVKSSVGRKYIMGISGLIWLGFVLAHMAGNMLILISPDVYNIYGHAIVSNKPVLYGAETVLILALFLHVATAVSLTIENRKSKGSRYAVPASGAKASTIASRTMGMQGSVILAFVILHLATFKYGTHYDTIVDGVKMRDLHRLIVEVFQQPGYVAWYVVALVLLMFHLSHGAHSIFQSFGFLERKMQQPLKKIAWAYAIIVAAGFLSQPAYVFLLKGN